MSECRAVSQYHSFVIMLCGAATTHPLDKGTVFLCSFAVNDCMGCKIEVEETVSHKF